MQQFGNKYNDAKLSQLKMWMQNMIDKGTPKYYEVYVDDTLVVSRTQEIDDFDDHKAYMDQDTRFVKVFIFNTLNTHRYKQYVYEIKLGNSSMNSKEDRSLSGIEVDQKIAQERERWDGERIKEKLFQKEKELAEAEEYIGRLTTMNEKLKEELDETTKSKGGWLGIAEKIITSPQVIMRVGELAGFFPKKSENELSGTDSEVTYSKKDSDEEEEDEKITDLRTAEEIEEAEELSETDSEKDTEETVSPAQQKVIDALHKVDGKLKEEELSQLGELMNRLADDPSQIILVHDLIKKQNEY
jgi:hypothetical protein